MQRIKSGLRNGTFALMVGLAAGLAAQVTPGEARADSPLREITVSGQGSVAAGPDMATITIGVTEQADEARDAMQQASVSVSAILERLGEMGIDPSDIQTRRLTVNPVWSNRRSGDEPAQITGFVASNAISLRIRDLSSLGGVLDQILAEGANDFGGLQFSLQDPEPLVNDARRAAVADAMAKAQLYAEAAGVTLGPVQSLSEQGGNPRPMMMEMAAARDVSVPVAQGEVTVESSVTMVFTIAD
ncbi:SIMPL domain-containing protein [Marinibacterium sp. SX1]|uniref:SIMPL domain-containing protein n=1 Tax=Marinibacterium sp. SX1 TaxID=3388424 RepID=UPI003D17A17E